MKNLNCSKVDVAVLIIFFNREQQFGQVFDAVKQARPSRLYLYQDGPRSNSNDMDGIMRCRKIAEEIDWECEVHHLYQEKNLGCDPSEFIAQKWFFEQEEMGIVLEDDDVPSQSFFPYCKILLEKYKDDQRIALICGMNSIGIADWCPNSYFFARGGSIWGWASWRRVYENLQENIPFLEDDYFKKLLRDNNDNAEGLLKKAAINNTTGRAYYETILGMAIYRNNQVNIIPTQNMITNVGIAEESTHSVADIRCVPRRKRVLFYMKRYEAEFPLRHPLYVMRDLEFERRVKEIRSNSIWIKMESFFLRCRYLGIKKTLYDHIKRRKRI